MKIGPICEICSTSTDCQNQANFHPCTHYFFLLSNLNQIGQQIVACKLHVAFTNFVMPDLAWREKTEKLLFYLKYMYM